MKKILQEPFIHFLLIGAAIFIGYKAINSGEEKENVIIIDDSDIDRMINTWQMQWQRPPTAEELNGLVAQYLRQEVYYREALKMQLDHNDEIVKRRLYQKMEFLMDDIAEMEEPTDAKLKEYYLEHRESYLAAPLLSLSAIYFDPDRRSDAEADARDLLGRLPPGIEKDFDARAYGDAAMIETQFLDTDHASLARVMGSAFADAVFELEAGKWQGPVASGFGMHLIYIHEKKLPAEPSWEDVRGRVAADFAHERQQDYSESVYAEMQKKYKVEFDIADSIRVDIEK